MSTPFIVGAMLGLSVQFYANAIRKLPLMRHPWEHLILMSAGGVTGYLVKRHEESMLNELDEFLTLNGKTVPFVEERRELRRLEMLKASVGDQGSL